jgi:hypothetical protein
VGEPAPGFILFNPDGPGCALIAAAAKLSSAVKPQVCLPQRQFYENMLNGEGQRHGAEPVPPSFTCFRRAESEIADGQPVLFGNF